MWPDRVLDPGPLAHESDALPTALHGSVITISRFITVIFLGGAYQ